MSDLDEDGGHDRLIEDLPPYQCLTVKEVAGALRVSTKTIQRLIGTGNLKCLRIGRRVVVSQEEIMRFVHGENRPC